MSHSHTGRASAPRLTPRSLATATAALVARITQSSEQAKTVRPLRNSRVQLKTTSRSFNPNNWNPHSHHPTTGAKENR